MNDYRKGMEDAWKLALHAKSSGAAEDAIRAVLDEGYIYLTNLEIGFRKIGWGRS